MTDVKTETPTVELTLAPTLDAAPVPTLANTSGDALAPASDAAEVPAKLDDSMLTEEEKKMVESFSQQINVRDTAMVLQYGAGAQKKMADFSDTALESVRTKDLGEVGGLLSDAVTELRSFDATEEKGLFGFFKKGANKIESLRARYDKAEANVDKIVKALQGHQMTLMKDAATLDKMYELNLTYFKELTMYIIAGKKKLEQVRAEDLPKLVEKAQKSGLPEDAQAAKDLGVEFVELDDLFSRSDVLGLQMPLMDFNTGIINKENIAKMKDGVIIINNSRGQMVVEQDLADALNSGKVACAGLDVVSTEPIRADNPLLKAKNCIITPHMSWGSRSSRQRIMDCTVENVRAFLAGQPQNVVNK